MLFNLPPAVQYAGRLARGSRGGSQGAVEDQPGRVEPTIEDRLMTPRSSNTDGVNWQLAFTVARRHVVGRQFDRKGRRAYPRGRRRPADDQLEREHDRLTDRCSLSLQ